MLSSAILEYNIPGVIVSVRIPSKYIESVHSNKEVSENQEHSNQIVDINVKKLFQHLLPKSIENCIRFG